ncbi:phosphocarrier protein [Selenomonas sp. KH1T6]|nr:phosphocarrier protein [Selenomonas ruminantium]
MSRENDGFPEDIINDYGNRVEAATVVKNRYYLFVDMRPASVFASTAAKFKSKIQVKVDGETVDAKSILMLWCISNHLTRGKSFTIIAEGIDAAEAVDSLLEMVAFRFGEE